MGREADPRPRDDNGQYVSHVPLDAVLEVFDTRTDAARPLTATDVMEALECSRRTAHNKLNELDDRGDLATRKVGARSRVWWVPLDAPEHVQSATARSEQHTTLESPAAAQTPAVTDAIEAAELPGSGPILDARREALSAAYEYLSAFPEAKKSDFLRDVYHDYPAGFESGEGWWNAIQPALKQLPGVDSPEERGHIWHFLGG